MLLKSLDEIRLIFQTVYQPEMSNFAMGAILGKGFVQTQVHTEFIARVPKAQML